MPEILDIVGCACTSTKRVISICSDEFRSLGVKNYLPSYMRFHNN